MINFDDYVTENKTQDNSKWPYIPDHPNRILIIGGSGSGKANALLNLINNQPDIDKIYLYTKDPYEANWVFKCYWVFKWYLQDVYKVIDEYNTDKDRKILIVFDDIIADMVINKKKLNSIVTNFFIRGRKLIISLVFITQSYFKGAKDVRLLRTC